MSSSNSRKAGRPNRTVVLNLNNIETTILNVKSICINDHTRELVLDLCERLKNDLVTKSDTETQTSIQSTSKGTQTYSKVSTDKTPIKVKTYASRGSQTSVEVNLVFLALKTNKKRLKNQIMLKKNKLLVQ